MNPDGPLEISFDVAGWPPLKNEAKSLLAAGHKHHGSVRALLEAAAAASQYVGWTMVSADIGLDVVVQAPAGRPPGDATNYLGGIGDVLQSKSSSRMDLSYLGALQEVALYVDDRQIRRVTYNVVRAESASYTVRVSILDDW